MRRLLAAVALAGVVAACGSAAAPSTPPPSPLPSPSGTVAQITQQDDGKTVDVRVGDLVQVSLGDQLDWSLDISDPSVLSAEPGVNALVRGTQLLARAHRPGTAVIHGQGKPRCAPNQPCPQFLAVFTVTIVVR